MKPAPIDLEPLGTSTDACNVSRIDLRLFHPISRPSAIDIRTPKRAPQPPREGDRVSVTVKVTFGVVSTTGSVAGRGGGCWILGVCAVALGAGILIAACFPVGALMFLVAVLLIACGCACVRKVRMRP